jgi:Glycosyl transferase family 2
MRETEEDGRHTGTRQGCLLRLISSGDDRLDLQVHAFLTELGVEVCPRDASPEAALSVEVVAVVDNPAAVLDVLGSQGLLHPVGEEVARIRLAAVRHLGSSTPNTRSERVGPGDLSGFIPPPGPAATASVVLTCRDDSDLLLDALASVRLCAQEGLEAVIVDDGSTAPATVRILAELERLGVRVAYQEHGGGARARNLGMALTTSPYILHLAAGTLLRPGFVPMAAARLSGEVGLGAVLAGFAEIGREPSAPTLPPFDIARLLSGSYPDTVAVFRRSALQDVGGWDERFATGEEWDILLGLADAGWRITSTDVIGGDRRESSGLTAGGDPEARIDIAVAIADKHHSLYHRHIGGVVRDYMSALLSEPPALVAAESGDSKEARRIRELADELAASQADAARLAGAARAAREGVADREARALAAERDAKMRVIAESRADAAESRAEVAESRAARAEEERAAILATRTFRWTEGLRSMYARYRRRLREMASG